MLKQFKVNEARNALWSFILSITVIKYVKGEDLRNEYSHKAKTNKTKQK